MTTGTTTNWRCWADWSKGRRLALRLADWLGRGRGRLRWLDEVYPPPRPGRAPDLSRWDRQELSAAWIGHATVLLRLGGCNILTDPVLMNRVGIGLGLLTGGPRRLVAPALRWRDLPRLDLILISHAHYDHLCRPTLVKLPKSVPVITAEHTADLIRDLGFRSVHELRWGESLSLKGLKITAREVRHWGARVFYDSHRRYSAYLVEAGRRRVLYGGDTAYHNYFTDIGGVDLAILGIGGYDPFVHNHATPEQALAMADHMRAERILPMHHSTFRLSREPKEEPLHRLLDALGRNADRVAIREVGEAWEM